MWKRGEGGKRRGGIGRMGRSNEVESRRGRGGMNREEEERLSCVCEIHMERNQTIYQKGIESREKERKKKSRKRKEKTKMDNV